MFNAFDKGQNIFFWENRDLDMESRKETLPKTNEIVFRCLSSHWGVLWSLIRSWRGWGHPLGVTCSPDPCSLFWLNKVGDVKARAFSNKFTAHGITLLAFGFAFLGTY